MVDAIVASHQFVAQEKDFKKKYRLVYGALSYEHNLGEKWTVGAKGTLGLGDMYDWVILEDSHAAVKTSGMSLEEELDLMKSSEIGMCALYLSIGYRITSNLKVKVETFSSISFNPFGNDNWHYSYLRENIFGLSLAIQYSFLDSLNTP